MRISGFSLSIVISILALTPAVAQIEGGLSGPALSRAVGILEQAAKAHGGRETLLSLQGLTVTYTGQIFDRSQAVRPSMPTPGQGYAATIHLDFANSRMRSERKLSLAGGLNFHWRWHRDGKSDHLVNALVGLYVPLPPQSSGLTWAIAQESVAPAIVRWALENIRQARHVGEWREGRNQYDVISLPWGSSVAYLYFGRRTHLLLRIETTQFLPNLGDFVRRIEFGSYQARDGLMLPGTVVRYEGAGKPFLRLTIDNADVNPSYTDELFVRGKNLREFATEPPRVETIAPRVHVVNGLAGGLYNIMAVELDGGLFLVDAPVGGPVTQVALTLLEDAVPGKTVKIAGLTHHHADHVSGVRALVSRGVPLLVTKQTRDYVQSILHAPYLTVTDPLALAPRLPKFEMAGKFWSRTDGTVTIEAHRFETPHAEEMLVFYVPEHRILFNSDLFSTIVPPNETTRRFLQLLDTLEASGRRVERIVGAHHGTVDRSMIEQAVKEAGL